ncbi:MAG: Lrp/AsnC ligand binding domain-containing protein [Promethearchaeota archaeon]|jgi:DNA-binding Lrp family transcriptional regulator
MVVVIVLIQVKAGTASAALEDIEKIPDMQHVHMVTGPYDIIAYADIPVKAGFRKLVERVHDAPGVERTETCMAI